MRRIRGPVLAVVVLLLAAGLHGLGWLSGAERSISDLWHELAGRRGEPQHVAIVAIDDAALLAHRDEPLVFWGPHFARVIEVLVGVGARVVGVDYLFSVSAESWLGRLELPESDVSRTWDIPLRTQLASGRVVLIGMIAGGLKPDLLLPVDDYLYALPHGAEDVGLANLLPDDDGAIRRFSPALFGDGAPPSLGFATLLAVRGVGLDPSAEAWELGGEDVANRPGGRPIGYLGPPGTIPRVSFGRLLAPDAPSDADVRALSGRIVLIAADHAGMQDLHLTPYGDLMTGAEVTANTVETLLTGRAPRLASTWATLVFLLAAAVLGAVVFLRLPPLQGAAAGAGFALVLGAAAYAAFLSDVVLPTATAEVAVLLAYLGALGLRLTGEERERARVKRMFGRYVSDEVVDKLLASGEQPDLGGESARVTVLFSDIRSFTTISEQLGPHEVVEMLNAYFGEVCEQLLEQGGTIDKFIGDAVMAVFGSPVPYPDHARRAARAALAMGETAERFRATMAERFAGRELPDFDIGVGVHTGEAVIGNVGSARRMEFTAIGDSVNVASRLEGVTKRLGVRIVISEATAQAAGHGLELGERQEVSVKGRDEPLVVYGLLGLDDAEGGA